jgi:hypothetical protein
LQDTGCRRKNEKPIPIVAAIAMFALGLGFSYHTEARGPTDQDYTRQTRPNEADLESHGNYRSRDGRDVHSPSKSKSGKVPSGASARCRDGSYSFGTHHRGTCTRHGGVAQWVN